MGAMIASLLAKKAIGHVAGLLVSKTAGAATIGSGTGIIAVLPGVLAGDAAAIGSLVLIIFTWLGTLWGRWRAGK